MKSRDCYLPNQNTGIFGRIRSRYLILKANEALLVLTFQCVLLELRGLEQLVELLHQARAEGSSLEGPPGSRQVRLRQLEDLGQPDGGQHGLRRVR